MPTRQVALAEIPSELRRGLDRLAQSAQLPGPFPEAVIAEAEVSVGNGPRPGPRRADLTGLDFITIDPPGAKDLDQALLIERLGTGFRVRYAITDMAAWIEPGGAIDQEAHRRGQTFYGPNFRVPLHPPILSEGAASLLPEGIERPANVWQMDLDADGALDRVSVSPAWVRSRAKLTYQQVQDDIDKGHAKESLTLLRTVGELRLQQEIERGGVSLNMPEQEIIATGDEWTLAFRTPLPVEGWNAEVSLLTGICAAQIMLDAGVGILRTLPPAQPDSIARLRRIAKSLDIDWPAAQRYPDFVRSLNPGRPLDQAMLNACTLLFRGAGYTVIAPDGDQQQLLHGALATPYAHTTAPLRRLVDRYTGQLCSQLSMGLPVSEWVTAALPELPETMAESTRRSNIFERGSVNLVEALVLSSHLGERFSGTVIEVEREGNQGFASIPLVAVEAPVTGNGLELGEQAWFELTKADVTRGEVELVARG